MVPTPTIEVSPVEYAAILHAQLKAGLHNNPSRYTRDLAAILNWPVERVIRNIDADLLIVNKPHRELCRRRFHVDR